MTMETTDVVWMDGAFVPWKDAAIHVVTHGLHYGSGVFEGMRSHRTHEGAIALYRVDDHLDRFFNSAASIALRLPYSKEQLKSALIELVRRNGARELYIRPLAFYPYGVMGVHANNLVAQVTLSCWPWAKYFSKDAADAKISSVRRLSPRSVDPEGKICGHYVNSMRALQEIHGTAYDEVVMLDDDGFVAEGSAENIFIVSNGILKTPQRGTALYGITRRTILQLAEEDGITVAEQKVTTDELFDADEAFFTGTAVKILPIGSVDQRPLRSRNGPVTRRLHELYANVLGGRDPRHADWLTYI